MNFVGTLEKNNSTSKRIPGRVQPVISEVRRELLSIYRDRLKKLILYGSFARGDYKKDSDIDIILLLDRLTDIHDERARFSSVIGELSLKYDTVISVIPFDYSEFRSKKTPLILNVNKEGILF